MKNSSSLRITEGTWKQECGRLLARKPWVKLWGPRFDLVPKPALIQFAKPGRTTSHKFARRKKTDCSKTTLSAYDSIMTVNTSNESLD